MRRPKQESLKAFLCNVITEKSLQEVPKAHSLGPRRPMAGVRRALPAFPDAGVSFPFLLFFASHRPLYLKGFPFFPISASVDAEPLLVYSTWKRVQGGPLSHLSMSPIHEGLVPRFFAWVSPFPICMGFGSSFSFFSPFFSQRLILGFVVCAILKRFRRVPFKVMRHLDAECELL